MSVNRERPHVLVLPEDDANRQLANGFHLHVQWSRQRQMQVLSVAGGWREVLHSFETVHVAEMDRCPQRWMILLIDFDALEQRLPEAKATVPDRLMQRVFVLGVWSNPESLKAALGDPYEKIGEKMAKDCRDGTNTTWGHPLLHHNVAELDRLRQHICPILFPA